MRREASEKSYTVRQYRDEDLPFVSRLFFDTVHSVNAADYTYAQLSAWAPAPNCLDAKREAFLRQNTLVAESCGRIVGFGSADGEYLDMLFTHKDHLHLGIASAIADRLECGARQMKVCASVTAKPFFEKRGYKTIKEHTAERRGVSLTNYEMVLIRPSATQNR